MTSVGVSLMPLENRRETIVRTATEAERRGYAGFYLPETWAHDVTVLLAEAAVLYPRTISRLGFAKEVEAVIAANTTRGSAVVPAEAEVLLGELTVYGTPEQARARLARWQEAGIAMPILLLPPNQTPAQIDFALEALC